MSLNSPTNLNLIVQDFIKAISSGTEMVDGYIIGGSVQGSIEPSVDEKTEKNNQKESSSNLELILGVSIPLGVISNFIFNFSFNSNYCHSSKNKPEKKVNLQRRKWKKWFAPIDWGKFYCRWNLEVIKNMILF